MTKPVRSSAGDTYPPEASWAAHLIDQPYSAAYSRIPVVGLAREAGTNAVFEVCPGPGRWSDEAKHRFTELKAPQRFVKVHYHVEMQIAAWMVRSGRTDAELVINREPCGERYDVGCHQALPVFLPKGYRLFLSGTRGGSQYYSYSYDGRARS